VARGGEDDIRSVSHDARGGKAWKRSSRKHLCNASPSGNRTGLALVVTGLVLVLTGLIPVLTSIDPIERLRRKLRYRTLRAYERVRHHDRPATLASLSLGSLDASLDTLHT